MKIQEKLSTSFEKLKKIDYIGISKELSFFSKFFLLVIVYLLYSFVVAFGRFLQKIPLLGSLLKPVKVLLKKGYLKIIHLLNKETEGEISSLDLILLANGHLKAKKNRTIITVGGMAIGFGSVVFLLSMGYGAQELVVSRVARLGEMKQADVSIGKATSLFLDDSVIDSFSQIDGVKSVIPIVMAVSKVEYNNSVSDAVAYGVTREFLVEAALQPSKGKIFEDGEIISELPVDESKGVVAGAQIERISGAKMNKQISEIIYSLHPLIWKEVYKEPSLESEIIGYTRRNVGEQQAIEVWGNKYSSIYDLPEGVDFFGNEYSPWISDYFPLWNKEECAESDFNCVDGEYVIKKNGNLQQIKSGYLTEDYSTLSRYQIISDDKQNLEEGEVIDEIQFSFISNNKVPVYSDMKKSAEMLNLFSAQKTEETLYSGELVFGENYYDADGWGSAGTNENNKEVGYWIRSKLPLWRQMDCQDCNELYILEVDDYDNQVESYAFIPANIVDIENLDEPVHFGQVLGEATASAQVASSDSISEENELIEEVTEITSEDGTTISAVQQDDGTLDWISIASGSATANMDKIEKIPFASNSQKVALINKAMLNVLGLTEGEVLGKTFETFILLDNSFFKDADYQAESESTELTIIGIIPEDKTPGFYLPFSDIKNLGVENYSQVKVVAEDKKDLKGIRQEIESMGYRTSSVADTVGRINSLFGTIRLLLSVLGFIALSIAALGMFNTLTVSLLEKTREVGLMKAIGMKSNEVKRLFLAESIIMGLSGGIFGLILGVAAGYVLSISLSAISITKGLGYINLVFVPFYLAISILGLSFVVGVATGFYPAVRATRISALNALRYE